MRRTGRRRTTRCRGTYPSPLLSSPSYSAPFPSASAHGYVPVYFPIRLSPRPRGALGSEARGSARRRRRPTNAPGVVPREPRGAGGMDGRCHGDAEKEAYRVLRSVFDLPARGYVFRSLTAGARQGRVPHSRLRRALRLRLVLATWARTGATCTYGRHRVQSGTTRASRSGGGFLLPPDPSVLRIPSPMPILHPH
ncbi:hypothetical protein C8J57DRAFT_1533762 [Mycena rebaudengoi]|nr:hypothetical protein C8J57DRAFT_1533762 [Mycena rebaudengoi]